MTLTLAIAIVFGVLAYAAASDVISRRIPNQLSSVIAASFVIAGVASPDRVDLLGGLWVAAAVLAVGFVGFLFGKIGGGDVKLLAAMGLWAGPAAAMDFLLLTGLAGGGLALLYLVPEISHAMTWFRAQIEKQAPIVQQIAIASDVKTQGLPYGVAIAAGGMFVLWSRYVPL
jgi:prepilin peptidase CpaA